MVDGYKEAVSEALLRKAVIEDHMNELDAIPSNDELAAMYTFSTRHEARMRALFKKEERRERWTGFAKVMKRVAILVVIAVTLVFGLLLTNPTVRAAVKETIIEWFEKFTRFSFNSDSPEEAVADWAFGYVPDGYALSDNYELGAAKYKVYKNESLGEITFYCSSADNTSIGVDNEHSVYQMIYEQGIEYHIYEASSDEYQSTVLWTRDGYAMRLRSYCVPDELLRMAQSVDNN